MKPVTKLFTLTSGLLVSGILLAQPEQVYEITESQAKAMVDEAVEYGYKKALQELYESCTETQAFILVGMDGEEKEYLCVLKEGKREL